jgi:hypothetical protein
VERILELVRERLPQTGGARPDHDDRQGQATAPPCQGPA